MKSVFVVTDGAYSDYHICAVFSSREKAEAYVGESQAQIEEYVLDETNGERFVKRFYVTIDAENGNLLEEHDPTWARCDDGDRGGATVVRGGDGRAVANAWSNVGREHALKLAAEKRQEWLRERATTKAQPAAVEERRYNKDGYRE